MDRLTQIETGIEFAQKRVDKAARVLELYDDPRFKEVIINGYFEAEAIRMVGLYGSGSGSQEQLRDLEKDMHAVGALRRYLSMIVQDGRMAEGDLQANKEALQEELAERAEAQRNGEDLPLSNDPDYAGSLGA